MAVNTSSSSLIYCTPEAGRKGGGVFRRACSSSVPKVAEFGLFPRCSQFAVI